MINIISSYSIFKTLSENAIENIYVICSLSHSNRKKWYVSRQISIDNCEYYSQFPKNQMTTPTLIQESTFTQTSNIYIESNSGYVWSETP